jgi:hypothetical protein
MRSPSAVELGGLYSGFVVAMGEGDRVVLQMFLLHSDSFGALAQVLIKHFISQFSPRDFRSEASILTKSPPF